MAQEEIKEKIEEFLNSLTPEDQGQFYTELMQAYIETSNKVNKEYLKELEGISQLFKEIKAKEDKLKRDELAANI